MGHWRTNSGFSEEIPSVKFLLVEMTPAWDSPVLRFYVVDRSRGVKLICPRGLAAIMNAIHDERYRLVIILFTMYNK